MPMGFGPLSSRAFSEIRDLPLPETVAVVAPSSGRVLDYSLELYASATTIYAAMLPFNTLPTNALANQPFEGTLKKSITFRATIANSDMMGGRVQSGYGDIELHNPSGRYDSVYLNNSFDGRPFVVRYGPIIPVPGDPLGIPVSFDLWPAMISGLVQNVHLEADVLRIVVRDNAFKLDGPASPNTYGGTGGVDGTADMTGKRKPLAFGPANNVTPASVDPAYLVYQVHDGAVNAIPAVYDTGYPLSGPSADYATYAALIAATIPAGSYATCKVQGLLRLGARAFGLVTADVQGDSGGTAGYVTDTAAVARRVIAFAAPQVDLIDEGSFLALSALQPAVIAYYLGIDEGKTVRQVIDELMIGIGGFGYFRRDGTFEVGLFSTPAATPVDSYTEIDWIDGSLKTVDLPDGIDPPPKRVRCAFARNWTVQSDGLDPTRATTIKAPYKVATHSNTTLAGTIATAHRLAQDPEPVQSWFRDEADAVAECDRRLTLYGGARRQRYSFVDKSGRALTRKMGQTIKITNPRYDLAAGKNLVIDTLNDDTTDNAVEVVAFG